MDIVFLRDPSPCGHICSAPHSNVVIRYYWHRPPWVNCDCYRSDSICTVWTVTLKPMPPRDILSSLQKPLSSRRHICFCLVMISHWLCVTNGTWYTTIQYDMILQNSSDIPHSESLQMDDRQRHAGSGSTSCLLQVLRLGHVRIFLHYDRTQHDIMRCDVV